MPRLAILSDTHIPSRAEGMPDWVEAELRDADQVIHAGDFDSPAAYERVEALADGDLVAVRGNMDPRSLPLPATATVEIGDQTFVVTHGTGGPAGYQERVRQTVRDDGYPEAIAISGHTHSVLDSEDAIRILNPGSATGAAPATEATMMLADVDASGVSVEVLREGHHQG